MASKGVMKSEGSDLRITEATIDDIQRAFAQEKLTSTKLVDMYLRRIESFDPVLGSVLEVNPDARDEAARADGERRDLDRSSLGPLHGIPVLVKDSIATKDKMNTSCGSYALVGAQVPRDAHVVTKLREAGAIILAKTCLTEWYGTRSFDIPAGWCPRRGLALNPYVKSRKLYGSSFGSAISVAVNMGAVSLGTETHGSIIGPADQNSVVGIRPTVGLTSRAGVIPISPRQDTVGPICRTVSDAVHVLDVIVGFDQRDYEATHFAAQFIPQGGYRQFLNKKGLKGKRLGVVRKLFSESYKGSDAIPTFDNHLKLVRKRGAIVVDNLEIPHIDTIQNHFLSGEFTATLAGFKSSINKYLKELVSSPVKSLHDIIQFNEKNADKEMTREYGQNLFVAAETMDFGEDGREAAKKMEELSKEGFEKVMKENKLDGLVSLGISSCAMLAIGGYPAITVPAGFDHSGMPFGLCFGGLKGSEPTLIQIAYDFEQSTMARRPPNSYS